MVEHLVGNRIVTKNTGNIIGQISRNIVVAYIYDMRVETKAWNW